MVSLTQFEAKLQTSGYM